MNAAECRQMVEAARRANVLFGVAHVFRFNQSVGRLRERVAADEIGQPLFARSEFHFMAGPRPVRSWLYDHKIAGGGPIADIGVHCIDSLRYILHDEVMRVSAWSLPNRKAPEIEVAGALTLEFSRGTIGTVLCSFVAEYRTPLELIGGSGVLRADNCLNVDTPVVIELRRGGKTVESERETVSNHLAYARQIDAFAAAIEGQTEFLIPGEQGWQNQEILDAAYHSVQTGKTEEVPKVP